MGTVAKLISLLGITISCIGCQNGGIMPDFVTTQNTSKNEIQLMKCFETIKIKLVNNELRFDESVEDLLGYKISETGSLITQMDNVKNAYSYGYKARSDVLVSLNSYKNQKYNTLVSSISRGDSDVMPTLKVYFSLRTVGEKATVEIKQVFDYDKSCRKSLKATYLTTTSFTETQYKVSIKRIHSGHGVGAIKHFQKSYPYVKQDARSTIIEEQTSIEEFEKLSKKHKNIKIVNVSGLPSSKTLEVKKLANSIGVDPLTKNETAFKNFQMIERRGISTQISNYSFSTDSKFYAVSSETWEERYVNQEHWLKSSAPSIQSRNNTKIVGTSEFTSARLPLFLIESNYDLYYTNQRAYFKLVSDITPNSKWIFRKVYQSVLPSTPEVASLVDSKNREDQPFLNSSTLVEVNSPEIQKIVKKLDRYKKENRVQMALRVAKIVRDLLTYDYQSVDNNEVYALSTSDILIREKGVCQHYANVFAAIGRAVGLPTRIIVGDRVDDGVVTAHAWNEIEVYEGVWIPVEPQFEKLYIYPGRFIPASVSTYLETGFYSPEEIKGWGIRFEYTLMKLVKAKVVEEL